MKFNLSTAQVLVPHLGRKVLLTEAIDDGISVYPIGCVGTFDALQASGDDEVIAIVIFDNDPGGCCVEVPLNNFMPMEFIESKYKIDKVKLSEVKVYRSPSFKSSIATN